MPPLSLPFFGQKRVVSDEQQIKKWDNFFLELNQPNFFLYKVLSKKNHELQGTLYVDRLQNQ